MDRTEGCQEDDGRTHLSWDEMDSLAESCREALSSDDHCDDIKDVEFVITGEDGYWRLDHYNGHLVVEQDVDLPNAEGGSDNMGGAVVHVGVVDGACSASCRDARADGELAMSLPREVKCGGVVWKLQGGVNWGEPEYVSDVGWVSYGLWYAAQARGRWSRGDGYGNEPAKAYKTYREAMQAQVAASKRESVPTHCEECGHRLRRGK